MLERAAIVLVAIALVTVLSLTVRAYVRRRALGLAGTEIPDQLGALLDGAVPGIVYFYGPHCATCRQQAMVLEEIQESRSVSIARVDASIETGLADVYGVMTVPSTVVVDRLMRVRNVNIGFRSAGALQTQLLAIGAEEELESASA